MAATSCSPGRAARARRRTPTRHCRLQPRGAYVAAVDLFELVDASELARALTIRLLSNRPALKRALGEASGAGQQSLTILRQAAVVRVRQDLGDGVEVVFEAGADRQDPDDHTRLWAGLELAERLAERDGKRVVLFFDEFQEIVAADKRFGDPDQITRFMRSLFQRSRNVRVLFAGSIEHLMRDLFAPTDRAEPAQSLPRKCGTRDRTQRPVRQGF